MDDQKAIIEMEIVQLTEADIRKQKELEQCTKYIQKLIDRRTSMEQDIGECCELGYVINEMTPIQNEELEDFCSLELDCNGDIWEAYLEMDHEKSKILEKYVYEHLTIGQVIDLYLEISTVED